MKSKQYVKSEIIDEVRAAAVAELGSVEACVPEKRPLRRPVRPPEPFPIEALGGRLMPVARALADVTQAPIEACAQLALAVANVAVHGLVDVAMPHGVRPISLFFLAILPSGERKSAVFNAAMQGVYRFESFLRQQYAEVEELRKARIDVPLPPQPVVTISESTIDGLMKFLTQSRGSAIVATDEAAVFAGGHSMASKDLLRTCALYSSLWDSSPLKMARATTDHRIITGVRVGMCLMAQPPAVAALLSDATVRAQGLLGRFLMAMPASRVGERFYRAPSEESVETLEAFHARIYSILRMPLPLAQGQKNVVEPRHITLSPQAVEVFVSFHDEVEALVVEGKRYFPIREFGCKAAEHAVRLAATISLYHNRGAEIITAARMIDGVTLARFYLEEALRIAASEGDPDLQLAEKTLAWINRLARDEIGFSEIYRDGPTDIRKADTARRITKLLVEHGYLAAVEGGVKIKGKICKGFRVL